jgi:hypothetical protein
VREVQCKSGLSGSNGSRAIAIATEQQRRASRYGTANTSRSVEQPSARARQILVSGSLSGIADRAISAAFMPRNLRKLMWIRLARRSHR